MIGPLRASARILVLSVATTALYLLYLIGRTLTRRSLGWRNCMVRTWARMVASCMGLHSSIEGPRPTGAFLLVANHVSYVDIFLLSQCVDVVFVAKSDVRSWPAIGALARSVDTIFIDRTSRRDAVRVSGAIDDALESGVSVAIFPEGTSTDGSDVLPFKTALLEGAARNELPVHHAALRYAPPEVAWWGEMTLLPHVWKLLQVRRIDASLKFGGPVVASCRKELAARLHERIQSDVRPGAR